MRSASFIYISHLHLIFRSRLAAGETPKMSVAKKGDVFREPHQIKKSDDE